MQQKRFFPKKRLGQHFLRDSRMIGRIVQSLKLAPEDIVLEIGFGTGALTRRIVGIVRDYIGVEIDPSLHENIMELSGPHAHFLNQDILQLDLESLCREFSPPGGRFKVVGNLPYYVSSPILQYLAAHSSFLSLAVIMLQAEVADRVRASPGAKSYGVLTLLAQYHFRVKELFAIPPRAFFPAPQVVSKVLELIPVETERSKVEDEAGLFQFIKQAFSQRRKTLVNSLKGHRFFSPRQMEEHLLDLGYPPNIRAEAICLEDFIRLYQRTKNPE